MGRYDDTTTGRGDASHPNFAVMTLEEEARANGWTRITHPVGGEPDPAPMVGMRGEGDYDDDQSYGPPGA